MPVLTFSLKNPNFMFKATEKSDEWDFVLGGKCEKGWYSSSFTIRNGENSYEGFGATALVHVKRRPPRVEVPGISVLKPWDPDDEYRDIIRVDCPASKTGKPHFQLSVSLPLEAYQRVTDADWTKESLKLTVKTSLLEQSLIYGPDPDGQEIEWLTDKMTYSFLQEVTVHFLSASPKKLKLKKKYLKVLKNIESTLTPSPMLAPVERATQGIGDLRATIIRATWVIAALVIITAFIKSLVSG